MKRIQLFVLVTFAISFFAHAQTPQKSKLSDIPPNWKSIQESDYIILYPDSFELNTSGRMGTKFVLLSKQISAKDIFRENVNLIIQDLPNKSTTLDKFVEVSEDQIKRMVTNGIFLESKRIKTADSEYHKVIYSGQQGQYSLKYEQYFWVISGRAYVLTFTCELNQFDTYKDVGERILNSFKLK